MQLELAGLIGLPDGRYLSREDDGERVLVVQASAAPKAGGRRRRPTPVDSDALTEVPLTSVIVTGTERFESRGEARGWLEETASDTESRAALVRSATRLLNRALNALRAAARDPLVQDVGATRALAIRIGFGTGEEIADGHWSEAVQLPSRRGRLDDVDPQTRVAAVLSGREEVHPAETLLQRARLDLEQGRVDEAAYGLGAASTALEEIPGPQNEKLREQIREVERRLGDSSD